MNKELQDLAWPILPKEFKEEVKKEWRRAYYNNTKVILEYLFGKHNLTSDAEGEEMLTVPRKPIIQAYEKSCAKRATKYDVGYADCLYNLFGSKCLPDEACNVASSNVASTEPKPAEPKFKVGDTVRFKYCYTPHRINGLFTMSNSEMLYLVGEVWAKESVLEPYTEPTIFNKSSERSIE